MACCSCPRNWGVGLQLRAHSPHALPLGSDPLRTQPPPLPPTPFSNHLHTRQHPHTYSLAHRASFCLRLCSPCCLSPTWQMCVLFRPTQLRAQLERHGPPHLAMESHTCCSPHTTFPCNQPISYPPPSTHLSTYAPPNSSPSHPQCHQSCVGCCIDRDPWARPLTITTPHPFTLPPCASCGIYSQGCVWKIVGFKHVISPEELSIICPPHTHRPTPPAPTMS